MPYMTRQTRPRLRARLSGHFSYARSKWLLAEGASQTNFAHGRGTLPDHALPKHPAIALKLGALFVPSAEFGGHLSTVHQ